MAARRTMTAGVVVLLLKTRSFHAFQICQSTATIPDRQIWRGTGVGEAAAQSEPSIGWGGTPSKRQTAAAEGHAKRRWWPVSSVPQASQEAEGAQCLRNGLARVLNLSMAAR